MNYVFEVLIWVSIFFGRIALVYLAYYIPKEYGSYMAKKSKSIWAKSTSFVTVMTIILVVSFNWGGNSNAKKSEWFIAFIIPAIIGLINGFNSTLTEPKKPMQPFDNSQEAFIDRYKKEKAKNDNGVAGYNESQF